MEVDLSSTYKFRDFGPYPIFSKLRDALKYAEDIIEENEDYEKDEDFDRETWIQEGLPWDTLNYVARSEDGTMAVWINRQTIE